MPSGKSASKVPATRSSVPRVVLVDANVLYANTSRDLLMQFHSDEIIQVHWTKAIDDEWIRNLAADLSLDRNKIERGVARLMKLNVENWEVDGYQRLEGQFSKVDPKDRHIAAASYKLSHDEYPDHTVALVTNNIRHFPRSAFKNTRVTPQTFSDYVSALMAEEPDRVAKSCDHILARRNHAPKIRTDFVSELHMRQRCQDFAAQLKSHWGLPDSIGAPDAARPMAPTSKRARRTR